MLTVFSGTVAPSLWMPAGNVVSRGAGKESRGEPREQFAHLKRRVAEIIGRVERRTFPEPPGHRADAHVRCPAGRQIDRAVAHQKRVLRPDLEDGADSQQAVRRWLSRRLVAAHYRAKSRLDAQAAEDLPRKGARLVRQHAAGMGRPPEQFRDAVVEPRLRQQALGVLFAP